MEAIINGTRFVNLTPHAVTIRISDAFVTIPASGTVARAEQIVEELVPVAGIRVTRMTYGAVYGLPGKQQGVAYIVSARTAQAVPERDDVFIPGPKILDDEGAFLGCDGLCRI